MGVSAVRTEVPRRYNYSNRFHFYHSPSTKIPHDHTSLTLESFYILSLQKTENINYYYGLNHEVFKGFLKVVFKVLGVFLL